MGIKVKNAEQRLTYRLIAELGLLSAILIGATLTIARQPGSELRVPYTIQSCAKEKSHFNYNDRSTWCPVQEVTYK